MRRWSLLIIFSLIIILSAGCQSAQELEPTPTVDIPPTETPAPPPTKTPPPTVVPTSTPIPTPEPIPVSSEEGWELVWQDEFDGDEINPENWTYDIGGWGWGNGEAQYYTDRPENARVENGLLVIEARQERFEDSYYTSARLLTQGLHAFQYGRIEARIKVPSGVGTWPAFWMLGDNFGREPEQLAQCWRD
jgi:beta-glucanase (GH16 family)